MSFSYDFIGVGGLSYDLLMRVARLPLADAKYPAELLDKMPGGFIANATCAAARLGLRSGYIGWVGDDPEGTMLYTDFLAWKVEPTGLVVVPGQVTPFTLVITDAKGKRAILIPSFPLYRAELTYEQLALAGQARVLYSFPRDAVWCAQLRRASLDGGGLLALDVENAVPMHGDELREALCLADVIFLTEESLRKLRTKRLRDVAEGRQWVILTAGKRGAWGLAGGMRKPIHQPAYHVPVVDSTGAGDTFHAALLAAKLEGADLAEALRFASAAAALKIQHRGARGGLPTHAEVEQQMLLG